MLNRKILAKLIPILALGMFIIAGLVYGWEIKWSWRQYSQEREKTPSVSTAGWRTYRNEKYGFELKYPASLIIEDKTTDLVTWRYSHDTSYDPRRLVVKTEKIFPDNADLVSLAQEEVNRTERMGLFVEENGNNIPGFQYGTVSKTRSGMEYMPIRWFDFENGGWVEGVYLNVDSVIVSVSAYALERSDLFLDIIHSISLTE